MSRRFKDYYEIETVETSKGLQKIPVYKGGYYQFDISDESRKRYGWLFFVLSLLIMTLFILSGIQNNRFSRIIYIAVPYVIQLLPSLFLVTSSFVFLLKKGDLTVPEFISIFQKIKGMSLIILIFALITTGGSLYQMIAQEPKPEASETIFLVSSVLVCLLCGCVILFHRQMENRAKLRHANVTSPVIE